MFGFFKKKKKSTLNDLVFKSNQAAFEYACQYLDTSLENKNPVLAIVLHANNKSCCVKFSNNLDSSIPTGTVEELLGKETLDKNICFSASKIDHIENIEVGDLVMYITNPALALLGKGNMAGVLIAKVHPIYSLEEGGWVNK